MTRISTRWTQAFWIGVLAAGAAMAQTTPQSVLATRIYGIGPTTNIDCGVGCINNQSAYTRQNNSHSVSATGTGNWTVSLQYSDTSATGPWYSFGSQAIITQASNPAVAYGYGYHPYILVHVTGAALGTYIAVKDFPTMTNPGTVSFPIDFVGQVSNKGFFDVRDYGAKGDGSTDDTDAGQACIDAAHAMGAGACYFPAGTYIKSAPLRTYSVVGGLSVPYNGITIYGDGPGVTIIKTKSGLAPTDANLQDGIDLSYPLDLGNENPTSNVNIHDLTLDGNKSNVTEPAGGGAQDLSHNGILCTQCRNINIYNVETKNWWFEGVAYGLWTNYTVTTGLTCSNNGRSDVPAYGCYLLGGHSSHNTLTGLNSKGDLAAVNVGGDVHGNNLSGTIDLSTNALTTEDNPGSTSSGNTYTFNISNSTNDGWICENGAGGETSGNIYNLNITNSGYIGALLGVGCDGNSGNLSVGFSQQYGIDFFGNNNSFDIFAVGNGIASPMTTEGVIFEGGATRNTITGASVDYQASPTQISFWLKPLSTLNNVNGLTVYPITGIGDQGTNNTVSYSFGGQWVLPKSILLEGSVTLPNALPLLVNDASGSPHRTFLVDAGNNGHTGDMDSGLSGGGWYWHAKALHVWQINSINVMGLTGNGFYMYTNASDPYVPQMSGDGPGYAACVLAAGPPVVIGHCTTVVGSGGACTCSN